MPWVFIVRLLSRLLLLGALNRLASGGRRRAYGYPGAGRPGTPPIVPDPGRVARPLRALLGAAADPARLAGRLIAFAVFAAGSMTLLAAGTTLTTLGPRWLGISMLTLAALLLAAAILEVRAALRIRLRMRRRGAADRLLPPDSEKR